MIISIDLIISIGGFIIACASLIYTYTVKRKIDAQILEINDKTLRKLQSEESEKKKAKFKLNFYRLGVRRFKLGVKNIGLSDARNVSIELIIGKIEIIVESFIIPIFKVSF